MINVNVAEWIIRQSRLISFFYLLSSCSLLNLIVNQLDQLLILIIGYFDDFGALVHHIGLFEPTLRGDVVSHSIPLPLLDEEVLAPLIKHSTDL